MQPVPSDMNVTEATNLRPDLAHGTASAQPAHADWNLTATVTLGFLTVISAFNYLDRAILGLALPSIKAEIELSDTMLGLVSGLAFVTFYSLLGVPIAWLADRRSRRNIIAIGLAFWSVMTVFTGFVTNVWQLAAARFLMGAGEACCLAPSNSMISDLFRPARRPLALSIFGTANSIALTLFFPIMGWIAQHHGWRAMFAAAGAPGVLLAVLFLSVKEPPRGASELGRHQRDLMPQSLGSTLRFLFGSRSYLCVLGGAMCMGANIFATSTWWPTFLVRVHHFSLSEVGATLGPVRGILGAFGILAGGVLADRLGRRDARWRLRVPALACVLTGSAEMLFLLGDAKATWMAGLAFTSFFALLHIGPTFAVVLSISRVRMRAVASAIMVLCASLLGQAIGPLLVGYLNDRLSVDFGAQAVRYSLIVNAVGAVAGGLAFWAGTSRLEHDLQRASAE